jgi:hypothetical protein
MKFRILSLLEPSRLLQACNGIALPFIPVQEESVRSPNDSIVFQMRLTNALKQSKEPAGHK